MRLGDLDALSTVMEQAISDAPIYIQATVQQMIDCAPTIEPPVVRGHWIEPVLMHCEYGCMCSNCEKFNDVASNFCPNCGADMRGDNNGN